VSEPGLSVKVWVYILRSNTTGRYYCGQTSDLSRRVKQPNDPSHRGSQTTKRYEGPWKLVWFQDCPTRSAAMKPEREIKERGISRFLQEAQVVQTGTSGC
jgi:putative endonuclease